MYYNSPMRDKRSYYVTILQDGYAGTPTELYSSIEGLTLTHGKRDCDELTPILPSELTLRIKVLDNPESYKQLYSDRPQKYQVAVAELRGLQTVPIWSGYISSGQYEQPFAAPPFDVTIRANDGFEILKNTKYEESRGVRYTGIISLRALIERLLEPLQIATVPIIWGMEDVELAQTEETADLIGLSNPGIYAIFNNETPTHYDLLEAVLRNYGLQLFQMLGRWYVRPIFALAQTKRPSWFSTSYRAFGTIVRDAVAPLLWGIDGVGLSSSSTLSMTPPLREMTVSGLEKSKDIALSTMLQPNRWITRNAYQGAGNPLIRTYVGAGTEGIRVYSDHYTVTGEHNTAWLGFALDGVYSATQGSKITLSFKVYNLLAAESGIYAAIFAVPADINPLDWLVGEMLANVVVPEGVWCVTASGSWGNIGGASGYVMDNVFHQWLTLEKAKKNIPFTQRISLDLLTEQEWSLELDGIPAMENDKPARLVVVFTTKKDAPTAFELVDPRVSVTYAADIIEVPTPSVELISSYGPDKVSFDRRFAEFGAGTIGSGAFAIASVRIDSAAPIRGFIAPSKSLVLSQIAASHMRDFRANVTQTIEGDYYCLSRFDFNTVFEDDEGKLYYATYIQEIARRGLHNVQLRQLPAYMRGQRRWKVAETDALTGTLVSFDTTILYLSGNRLLMMDIVAEQVIEIATFEGTVAISKGANAACITEYLNGVYNLYAYNSLGDLLSEVKHVYTSITSPASSTEAESLPYNARYDSTTASWTIIGNIDASTDKLQISVVDKDGAQLIERITTHGRLTGEPRVFAGGFAFAATPLTASTPTILWHNYLIDEGLICTSPLGGGELADVNDMMFIVKSIVDGRMIVYTRNEMKLGPSLFSINAECADANNALVLARSGAIMTLFDARSAERHQLTATPTSSPVLVGHRLVFMQGTTVMILNLLISE